MKLELRDGGSLAGEMSGVVPAGIYEQADIVLKAKRLDTKELVKISWRQVKTIIFHAPKLDVEGEKEPAKAESTDVGE